MRPQAFGSRWRRPAGRSSAGLAVIAAAAVALLVLAALPPPALGQGTRTIGTRSDSIGVVGTGTGTSGGATRSGAGTGTTTTGTGADTDTETTGTGTGGTTGSGGGTGTSSTSGGATSSGSGSGVSTGGAKRRLQQASGGGTYSGPFKTVTWTWSTGRRLQQATDNTTPTADGSGGGGGGNTTIAGGSGGGGGGNTTTAGAVLPGDVTAVRSCLPYNILVVPGDGGGGAATNSTTAEGGGGGNATIFMSAEADVVNATDITYSSDGVLTLSLRQGYVSHHVINFTVTTAASNSLRYAQNFGPGNIIVGPGFSPDDFSAAATSIGGVLATGLTTPSVSVTNTGTGTVALDGTFGGGDIVTSGTAKVYLAGNTTGNVTVNADGISTTWIQGTDATSITGTANGMAKVLYTAGSCAVVSPYMSLFGVSVFGDPCKKATARSSPTFTPRWSCGQRVEGQSYCPTESESSLDFGSGGSSFTNEPPGAAEREPSRSSGTESTNTVSGEPGTVTTGTSTTPGGTSSASGSVSGPGGTIGGSQTGAEGSPPIFSASFPPPFPGIVNPVVGGDSVNPGGASGLINGDFSSAGTSAISTGGGPVSASSVSVTGQPPVTSTSGDQQQPADLDIPITGSGLAITSVSCDDPASASFIIPPAAATNTTGDGAAGGDGGGSTAGP